MSFRPGVEREATPGVTIVGDFSPSSSRYADPEAEGVTPVFRTSISQHIEYPISSYSNLHIFRRTLGALDLEGRSKFLVSLVRYLENTGAEVPPEGPLTLLRSVMFEFDLGK